MSYLVHGGIPLCGTVEVGSAKNCVLVQLASTVLVEGKTTIKNVEMISDVVVMLDILTSLGAYVTFNNGDVTVDATDINSTVIDEKHASKLRGSIFLLGALVGRFGKATTYLPGGCAIGSRPIDIHLNALRALGVEVEINGNKLMCSSKRVKGNDICLAMPSVGGTENALMCSVLAEGNSRIFNCAIEPEVVALEQSLISMGAVIENVGSRDIVVHGVSKLRGCAITPISDRIVTATFLSAMCMTRGNGVITKCNPNHLRPMIDVLTKSGVVISQGENSIAVVADNRYDGFGEIVTAPYPNFATDMQSLIMSMATIANGNTTIVETLFENRLQHNANELSKMGAQITVQGNSATIRGVSSLRGAAVNCGDLRGGASLVLAGLSAKGDTTVCQTQHISRGYFNFVEKLLSLGAEIDYI